MISTSRSVPLLIPDVPPPGRDADRLQVGTVFCSFIRVVNDTKPLGYSQFRLLEKVMQPPVVEGQREYHAVIVTISGNAQLCLEGVSIPLPHLKWFFARIPSPQIRMKNQTLV